MCAPIYASPRPGTPEWPTQASKHRCGYRVPEKECEEKKARLCPSFLHLSTVHCPLSTVQVRSLFDLEIPMRLVFVAVDMYHPPNKNQQLSRRDETITKWSRFGCANPLTISSTVSTTKYSIMLRS